MRLPADPEARLAKLRLARAQVGDGDVLTANEMAAASGLSWVGLKKWIDADPDFPVRARGGMGVAWEFEAAKALDHMIAQAEAARSQREARRASVARLAGLGSPPASPSPGAETGSASAADTMAEARALSALLDVQAKIRAERERQNALLAREAVQKFLWRWLSTLQSEVLAARGRIEKSKRLPPELVAALDDELGGVLVTMREALVTEIARQDAPRA